ncbi:MAG: methionyl-tRNA formyltransferase [Clostridia bacterium]|nr:methionyl-tRNA formyltransferase [Clostridia bacterium]
MSVRIVFMGTPEFAVPSLKALVDNGYDVVGVVTQPDRPKGRGKKLTPCPVKVCALERGLNVLQFEKVKSEEGMAAMRALAPDLIVTAAFGQILTAELLAIPPKGTVNVHASLLPKHRGSAPINRMILADEPVAGVTTMLTDVGIDTGDMLLKAETPIGENETAEELTVRLSEIGAELLIKTLEGYLNGTVLPEKQDESQMTYESMLTKEMGIIDWSMTAREISCRVRGLDPWPGTSTAYDGGRLKVYGVMPAEGAADAVPGTVLRSSAKEGLIVACGGGAVSLTEIQAPNGKRMAAKAYLSGKSIPVGTVLGAEECNE